MSQENAADWVLVATNGVRLVGRKPLLIPAEELPIGHWNLEPAYEVLWGELLVQPNPQAPPVIAQSGLRVVPVFSYAAIERVRVPPGALVVPFADLTEADRQGLWRAIEGCRQQAAQARSGLVVAPASLLRQ